MKSVRSIIFDLDGVLISTDHFHYLAWKKVSDELNITFNETMNHLLRGVSRLDSLDIILEKNDLKLSKEEKEQIAEDKNLYYRQYLEKLTPQDVSDEVIETLEELKKLGLKLAVGSSSKNALYILEQTDLIHYFDAISDGCNITLSKPHPEVFLKAAQYLLEEPGRCMVIEDAEAGIIAANAANMVSVGINGVKDSKQADYSIDYFKDILSIVREIA